MSQSVKLSRAKLGLLAFGVIPAIFFAVAACCIEDIIPGGHGVGTKLVIRNNTASPVPVLVTLGKGYEINSVLQLPFWWGIVPHLDGTFLKGSVVIGPGASLAFDSGDRSFSGNIAFGPTFTDMGCGGGACYPNATNLAEFTLNYPGETVDISNVNGTNAFIEYQLADGAVWTDNVSSDPVASFANKVIGQNANIPGVYGWQATTCTGNGNPPNPIPGCPAPNDVPPAAELSSSGMCNVQRAGDAAFGGTVTINFNGWTPNSEPPLFCGS